MRLIFLLSTLLISGCAAYKISSTTADEQLYTNALKEACIPLEKHIFDNLTAINDNNKGLVRKNINGQEYILTVSLKSAKAREWYSNDTDGFYNTGNYQIWVTVVPELKDKISGLKPVNIKIRLRQLLGLPPDGEYDYIVEFWVKPGDLFRPCPDSEIDDSKCGTEFPQSATHDYKQWFNDSRIDRYFASSKLYCKYPWTQLGYTYDWAPENTSHIGVSEFVIDKNKKVIVNSIFTIDDYFKR